MLQIHRGRILACPVHQCRFLSRGLALRNDCSAWIDMMAVNIRSLQVANVARVRDALGCDVHDRHSTVALSTSHVLAGPRATLTSQSKCCRAGSPATANPTQDE